MKKTLLLPLCLAIGMPGIAQSDVSAYFLTNHGFDEQFNYPADLQGNIAGDVINEVYGWDNETTATYTVAGTFAYNPSLTFNSSSALPASGYGDSEGGALGLTTGWGMQLAYTQTVSLPKGTYRLCAAYYNVGSATAGSSLLAWEPASGSGVSSAVAAFPIGAWRTDSLAFTLTAATEGKIRIGFAAQEGTGSGNHAKILVDYVKLLCYEVDKGQLAEALSEAGEAYADGTGTGAADLKAVMDRAQAVYDDEAAAAEDVIGLTNQLVAAVQTYRYANASVDQPLDLTSRVENPSFENGTTGWDNQGLLAQTNSVFTGKSGNTYLERWVNIGSCVPDVSISQRLEGIPNGRYRLLAAVSNIQQRGSGSTLNAGEKQTGVSLFAGFYSTPVDTMLRRKDLYFTVVDGTATIGFKAEGATGNWVCFDNVRLHYLGANTPADYAAYVANYMEVVRGMLADNLVQASVRQTAEGVLADAERAVGAEPLDSEALETVKAALDQTVTAIEASAARYAALSKSLDYAKLVQGWYADDAAKSARMAEAIEAAQLALANSQLTDNELVEARETLETVTAGVDKRVYTAQWSMGDVNDPDNNYYIGRTRQSKNWIVFWEKGYGDDPVTFTCGSYTIDVDELLRRAEIAFQFYRDSLKFITAGRSKTDTYKMVIRLRYAATEWEATGSGVDDLIGLLTLTPWAATSRNWQTLYHEIGHCFQYQVHCDNNNQNGWMYAPGGGYGCAFWEQCAQWQAYKIMPEAQFDNEWFSGYLQNVHKHILHESPRYNNYFVQDFWCYKHGMDFIGRLWNGSRNPEDAVEAYMRLTNITDSAFNDEMYECAARFATWDIPHLESYGASKVDSRPQPAMTCMDNNYWRINATVAPENTGHNIIRLNVPDGGTTVTACFEGLNRESGYRIQKYREANWRFGFVALLKDGSRVYGDMGRAKYLTPTDTISFECPADCRRLYFVVSGGARNYWCQVWDDNEDNDEQWPYQVKFGNTNRYGSANLPDETAVGAVVDAAKLPAIAVSGRTLRVGQSPLAARVRVVAVSGACVAERPAGQSAVSLTLQPGFYLVQVIDADGRTLMTQKVLLR